MNESRWRLESNAAESNNGTKGDVSRIQTVKLHRAQGLDRLSLVRCRQLVAEGMDLQLMVEDDDPLDYDSLLGSV
jgi:hypothetical protein